MKVQHGCGPLIIAALTILAGSCYRAQLSSSMTAAQHLRIGLLHAEGILSADRRETPARPRRLSSFTDSRSSLLVQMAKCQPSPAKASGVSR